MAGVVDCPNSCDVACMVPSERGSLIELNPVEAKRLGLESRSWGRKTARESSVLVRPNRLSLRISGTNPAYFGITARLLATAD